MTYKAQNDIMYTSDKERTPKGRRKRGKKMENKDIKIIMTTNKTKREAEEY